MADEVSEFHIIEEEMLEEASTKQRMQNALPLLRRARGTGDEPAPAESFDAIASIDWAQDVASTKAWLVALLEALPPGKDVRTLWFAIPEIDIAPAVIRVAGYAEFDPFDETLDWLDEPNWPTEAQSEKLEAGEIAGAEPFHVLNALEAVQDALGMKDGAGPGPNAPLCYGVPLAYVSFLMAEVGSTIDRSLFKTEDPICFVCSFASGDGFISGVIDERGWQSGRQPD